MSIPDFVTGLQIKAARPPGLDTRRCVREHGRRSPSRAGLFLPARAPSARAGAGACWDTRKAANAHQRPPLKSQPHLFDGPAGSGRRGFLPSPKSRFCYLSGYQITIIEETDIQ